MRRITLLAAVAALLAAGSAHAQDAHYWTQKYGTKALLLSGVAIGTGVDLSTTFYNPGGLALLPESLNVIAVKAFDFSNVKIENATVQGEDISEPHNSVLPTFFGGTVGVHLFGSSPLAYSLFPRQLAKFNLTTRAVQARDILPAPGLEQTVFEARFEEDLDETWGGLTWSRRMGPKLSLGLSAYGAIRSQRARRQIVAQALADATTAASGTDLRGFTYNDVRGIAKVGLAFELKRIRAGLTVTSPGLHIMGSADAGWDHYRDGLDVDGDGQLDNQLIATYQEGVGSKFKSPASVGAGVVFDLGTTTTVHASAEAFDAVDRYSVFETEPATDLGTGQSLPFEFFDERESVVNWGAGIEHKLGEVSSVFASFSTDYSSVPHGKSDLAIGDWDAYLITAGATIPVGRTEFTLGVGYGFGSGDAQRFERVADSPAAGTVLDQDFGEAETSYQNIRLIFGFTI